MNIVSINYESFIVILVHSVIYFPNRIINSTHVLRYINIKIAIHQVVIVVICQFST